MTVLAKVSSNLIDRSTDCSMACPRRCQIVLLHGPLDPVQSASACHEQNYWGALVPRINVENLEKCTQVFLRHNVARRALEAHTGSCHGERKHCKFSWRGRSVRRQGQAGLPTERERPRRHHHLQLRSQHNSSRCTTCRATTARRTNYTLRTPRMRPCPLQQGGKDDLGTAHINLSASQSEFRSHPMLGNVEINTFPKQRIHPRSVSTMRVSM
jgi:hypothetical protein